MFFYLHATRVPCVVLMEVTASNDRLEEVSGGEIAREHVLAPFRCQIEIQRRAVLSEQSGVVYRKSA